jgi:hypothetical protein
VHLQKPYKNTNKRQLLQLLAQPATSTDAKTQKRLAHFAGLLPAPDVMRVEGFEGAVARGAGRE